MKRVLLLLSQGVEVLEAAAFYDVLGWAGCYGNEPIEVVTVGLREEVECSFGLRVRPERLLSEVCAGDFDALAVPGGFEIYSFYDDAYSDQVSGFIRELSAQGKPIASICVGALAIARSGILDGCPATTYHLGDGRRRQQLAELGARVVDQPIVHSNNVITSTSPATAIEVALLLLEIVTSKENAADIRKLMGFPPDLQAVRRSPATTTSP